jgi:anaerobic selenocysteine-containing dehydrogenase
MAVQSLNALVGNINMPGGILVCDPPPLSPLPQIQKDKIASEGLKKPRLDHAGSRRYPFSKSLIGDFAKTITKNPKSPVNTLLVFSANPDFTLPDRGAFREALKKVPFIVSFSPYQDETSYMADLILPDHTYLEKMDDVVWPTGLQYPLYGISKPVVKPVYATRHSGDVIMRLAKRIGGSVGSSFPWKKYDDVLKERAKGLFDAQAGLVHYDGSVPPWKRLRERGRVTPDYKTFDDMWKKMKAGGLWYSPVHAYKNWEKLFKTPTGKFEFFSTRIELAFDDYALKSMGIAEKGDAVFMPHYEPALSGVDRSAYPLLMMPYEMINLASGWTPNPPYLNKTIFDNQLRRPPQNMGSRKATA